MPVERSKKTINAWSKFLKTEEGQEGLEWLFDQRPNTVLSDGPHLLTYSHGRIDEFLRLLDMIKKELPSHPKPPEPEQEERLLPTDR